MWKMSLGINVFTESQVSFKRTWMIKSRFGELATEEIKKIGNQVTMST